MQTNIFKISGLYDANNLSEMPAGALLDAENIDIPALGIARPRRGFEPYNYSNFSSPDNNRSDKIWFYQDKLFAHHGDTPGSATTVSYNNLVWNTVGSFSAPTGYRMRTMEASQNLYFTTSTGVKVLNAYNGTPRTVGVPKGIHFTLSLNDSANNQWLANGDSVGYRHVWNIKDVNDNLIQGAPSQFVQITNGSGNSRKVGLRIYIPGGITTSHFLQVYRSMSTSGEPRDELQLVYEVYPNSGNISAGYIDIVDITADELRGAALYTNASQQGLANQNEAVPLATDLAVFKGHMVYVNLTSKHRFYLTLLGTGSGGLVDSNTITIAGQTYTAKASPSLANDFALVTGISASTDIRETCLSLVNAINNNSSSPVYAYYISAVDQTPGRILIEEKSLGGSAFTVTSNNNVPWSPDLASNSTSQNDRKKNGIAVSKYGQPEHVPLTQYFSAGSEDHEIYRTIALKDSCFFLKPDGLYRMYGTDVSNFQVTLMDPSAIIVGKETAAVLNNTIYFLTVQGLASATETGVTIKSFAKIETELLKTMYTNADKLENMSFGVSYESDRKYYLWFPTAITNTYPDKAFVYNSFTNAFTEHLIDATCGVSYKNNLYLGHGGSSYIWRERKNITNLDYVDFGFETSVTDIDGLTLTLASGVDLVRYGDVIYQGQTVWARVTSTNILTSSLTVDINPGFVASTCEVYKAIPTKMTWNIVTGGAPANQKIFHTAILHFKSDFNGEASLTFKSDLSQYSETVPIVGQGSNPWGLFNWGEVIWGGEPRRGPIRQWVPAQKIRCNELEVTFEHAYGYSTWELLGISIEGELGSTKGVR